ncbi:hypothetical protein A9G43_00465 [Gilliamella sp. Occ3-1]|nr:hypothetical protein A9G43_00465 [Gilliamella apicola]
MCIKFGVFTIPDQKIIITFVINPFLLVGKMESAIVIKATGRNQYSQKVLANPYAPCMNFFMRFFAFVLLGFYFL